MKVCLVFRDPRKGGQSIEGIFNNIFSELSNNEFIDILKYEYKSDKSLIYNLYYLHKLNPDIFHVTGDINWISFFLFNKKIINTIHDIGTYYKLNTIKKYVYKILWIKMPIFLSHKVTVVSEFTKNEILKIYKTNKIVVIHNPINPLFKFHKKEFNKLCPTILIVGTAKHKNIENIFKAVIGLNVKLLIIGKLNEQQCLLLNNNNIIFENYFNLSTLEIYNAYINSDIVIFASLHEGFGMPIIESNAVGRPLILSNKCSMPNLSGNAALLFDPKNIFQLKSNIISIIDNQDMRNYLVEKGIENALKFNIKLISKSYLSIYINYV